MPPVLRVLKVSILDLVKLGLDPGPSLPIGVLQGRHGLQFCERLAQLVGEAESEEEVVVL